MRWAALLVCASGCLDAVTLDLDPDPLARTTVLMSGGSAFVVDHDTMPWNGIPLSVQKDEPLFALVYSQSIASLQLEAGLIARDPLGARDFPLPDLSLLKREPPFADSRWTDTELPDFKLPAYSFGKCADAELCLEGPADVLCGSCTATPAMPQTAIPDLPQVSPHARRQTCTAKSAHFLNAAGCEPIGVACSSTPPNAVTTTAELVAALATATPTITLAAGTFDLQATALAGPRTIRGCGGDSVIRLAPGASLFAASGTVALANLRIEGGNQALTVLPMATGRVEDVSIDGVGNFGLLSSGTLVAERVSIEGRTIGIHTEGGEATLRNVAIRDSRNHGVGCVGTNMSIVELGIEGTPTEPSGRGMLLVMGCSVSMEQVLVERGRRIAIETSNRTTSVIAADVTIRDIDRPETDGNGGLIDRNRARFTSIERFWIENVVGSGIVSSDPNAVIRDVYVDTVPPAQFPPAGIRFLIFDVDTGTLTLERIQVSGVDGAAIYMERNNYEPTPASANLRHITIAGSTNSELSAVVAKSINLSLEHVLIEGGNDGIETYSGSAGRLRDITVRDTSRFAINLRADAFTTMLVEDAFIEGCSHGLRAFRSFEPEPGKLPMVQLGASRVLVTGCDQYGVLIQGARGTLEDIVLQENKIGLGIGELSNVQMRNSVVRGNQLGARVAEDVPLNEILVDVKFSGNGNAIEISAP